MTTSAAITEQANAYRRWLARATPQQAETWLAAFLAVSQARDEEVAALTAARDAAREELRALVDATSWIGTLCVIDQSPVVGSNGALDRAMTALIAWENEADRD